MDGSKNEFPVKVKKKRNVFSLDHKFDIIKKHEHGMTKSAIARMCGISESTVRTIVKKADYYKEKGKAISTLPFGTQTTRNRSVTMIQMESLLSMWIEDCNKKHILLNTTTIKIKALSLFSAVKEKAAANGIKMANEHFTASSGWYDRFRLRSKLQNFRGTGEFVSVDEEAASKFPQALKKVIEEGSYSNQQIFNVDETKLFWKRMPSRSLVTRSDGELKLCQDWLTLLLGSNAEGDFKLKPMLVYRAKNPRAFKGYDQCSLPVFWRANRQGWVTKDLFEDWFINYFCPSVEKYCAENSQSHKVLLILNNSVGHSPALEKMCENVKVVFLPPNTTSLLQPMDLGISATFKAFYLRKTFKQAIIEAKGDNASLLNFWTKYNIKDAVVNIHESWMEVTASIVRIAWRTLLPDCVGTSDDYQAQVSKIGEEISDIGRMLSLAGLDFGNACPAPKLVSHIRIMADEDISNLKEVPKWVQTSPVLTEGFDFKKLERMLNTMEIFKRQMLNADPNTQRSRNTCRNLEEDIECYRQIYKAMKSSKD